MTSQAPTPHSLNDASLVSVRGPDGAHARVSPFGAHVLSWQPTQGGEQLFLSRRAVMDGSAPIRGGVPIVFPQFGPRGPLPQHGFARTSVWRTLPTSDAACVRMRLSSVDADADAPWRTLWPHDFACEFEVKVGGQGLALRLRVTNIGHHAFAFGAALHTYFRVDDVQALRLHGLQGTRYVDSLLQGATAVDAHSTQHEPALSFVQACDRIYAQAPERLTLHEPGRRVEVSMQGFNDTVVWNPGAERCAAIKDLEPSDHRRMVCVEAARVLEPVVLQPGASWEGRQHLEAKPA